MAEWPTVTIQEGFTYVQSGTPSGAEEGETWFDTDANESYVYTGSSWVSMTANDHSELSGVGSSDHHSRYSDSEARTAVDGSNVSITGDADTVDGQHASDLGGLNSSSNGSAIQGNDSKTVTVSVDPSANTILAARLSADDPDNSPTVGPEGTEDITYTAEFDGPNGEVTFHVTNNTGTYTDIIGTVIYP